MRSKKPNPAHLAIAECETRLSQQGRSVVVITQNIDELHRRAGSRNVLEIHGEYSAPDWHTVHPYNNETLFREKNVCNLQKESHSLQLNINAVELSIIILYRWMLILFNINCELLSPA